jgi:general secretion pathway protein L
VDRSLGALRALGLYPDRVTVGCDPEGGYPPVNLLPPEQRRRRGKVRRMLNTGLGALAGTLLVAVLAQPLWNKWKTIQLLEVEAAAAAQDAAAAEQLRQRVDQLTEAATFLVDKKRATPLVLEVLTELTSILPDDTWLSGVSIRGREVQLRGFSSASAALIPIVESSPLLRGASFRAPILRDSLSEAERFDLAAAIGAEKAP